MHWVNQEILPLTLRQVALGLLFILISCALLGLWYYHKHTRVSYQALRIPKIIYHKIAAELPDSAYESMSFVLPRLTN